MQGFYLTPNTTPLHIGRLHPSPLERGERIVSLLKKYCGGEAKTWLRENLQMCSALKHSFKRIRGESTVSHLKKYCGDDFKIVPGEPVQTHSILKLFKIKLLSPCTKKLRSPKRSVILFINKSITLLLKPRPCRRIVSFRF